MWTEEEEDEEAEAAEEEEQSSSVALIIFGQNIPGAYISSFFVLGSSPVNSSNEEWEMYVSRAQKRKRRGWEEEEEWFSVFVFN